MRGFSLIELMVVVAIVGLLAAIATPALSNYKNRAITAEALSAMMPAVKFLEETYAIRGVFNPEICVGDYLFAEPAGLTHRWRCNSNQQLELFFNVTAYPEFNGAAIILRPNADADTGVISWTCVSGFGGVPCDFLPANCLPGCDSS